MGLGGRMTTTNADVVVVGGGLAGLAAATFLARAGRRVRVFERAAEIGGRARTRTLDGFHFNQGAHALYRRGPAMSVLDELGVRVAGRSPDARGGFALRAGRVHTLPVGALSMLTTGVLTLPERLEAARLLSSLPRLDGRALDGVTLAAWMDQVGLRPGVRALLRMLLRLTTYADMPERQSAGAALEQLALGLRGVLYLDGGWQQLVDGLAEAARSAGVELNTHAPAARLHAHARGVVLTLEDGERVDAGAAVLALPPASVAALLPEARLPVCVPVRAACLDLGLRRLPRPRARLALGLDRPLYLSVHSAVARLAPAGGALVHLIQYLGDGDVGDVKELEGLLDLIQPGWRSEAVHTRFLPDMVVSNALVTAEAGGLAGRADVTALGLPSVVLAGDWVGPEGMLADAALASARRATRALLAPTVPPTRAGGNVSLQVA
jgi:phytoene dehydrogenase-like protein